MKKNHSSQKTKMLLLAIFLLLNIKSCFGQTPVNQTSRFDYRNFGILLETGRKFSKLRIYSWDANVGEDQFFNVNQLRTKDGQPYVARSAPGLAVFEQKPERVPRLVDPLLRFAKNEVPEEKHARTPLFVVGTEGFRRLTDTWVLKESLTAQEILFLTCCFAYSHVSFISII